MATARSGGASTRCSSNSSHPTLREVPQRPDIRLLSERASPG
jgi:hypothetical protein